MSTSNADAVAARAAELVRDGSGADVPAELLAAAGGDRRQVEAARDLVAARVRSRVDDFEATASLQLLNRALSRTPIDDPLDWKVRWGQRFRRP